MIVNTPAEYERAGKELSNPVPNTAATLVEGKRLFEVGDLRLRVKCIHHLRRSQVTPYALYAQPARTKQLRQQRRQLIPAHAQA